MNDPLYSPHVHATWVKTDQNPRARSHVRDQGIIQCCDDSQQSEPNLIHY